MDAEDGEVAVVDASEAGARRCIRGDGFKTQPGYVAEMEAESAAEALIGKEVRGLRRVLEQQAVHRPLRVRVEESHQGQGKAIGLLRR